MYSKNQLIKNVNQLNVQVNVQQLHVESIEKKNIYYNIKKIDWFLLVVFYMNQVF